MTAQVEAGSDHCVGKGLNELRGTMSPGRIDGFAMLKGGATASRLMQEGCTTTNSAPHQKSLQRAVLPSTLFPLIVVTSPARSSLIGRPIFSALIANSSAPTKMDDSAAHKHYNPVDWDNSMLAMHDRVYRQDPFPGNLEEALPIISIDHETTVKSTNTPLMNPDHGQNGIFEHWSNGKPPATDVGSTKLTPHKCGVETCEKAFVRKADLERHLKSHKNGPRTHSCLADRCPRKSIKGFWRLDKFKDHMQRKHPEIKYERCTFIDGTNCEKGYRDVEKREEHEALMLSKGYKPHAYIYWRMRFIKMAPWEMAVSE
ncbi:MAG: hypothetical protein Q9168_005857 [Polycauliona sp. 1 TL-2023]